MHRHAPLCDTAINTAGQCQRTEKTIEALLDVPGEDRSSAENAIHQFIRCNYGVMFIGLPG
jgi:hypothetical protein